MRPRAIVAEYWPFIRQYPTSHAAILFGYAFGQFGSSAIAPLVYKRIIDVVSGEAVGTPETALWYVGLLAVVIFFYNIGFRTADYFMVYAQSKIMEQLANHALRMLESHSHAFFVNTFAGGLVAKTRRFVNAFETLHDQFVFNIWMNGLALIFSIGVLWYQSWILGVVYFLWLLLYILLTSVLVRRQIPKSLENAAADSRTTAHFSDIVSNMLTVKMFGTGKRELLSFGTTTREQEKHRFASWLQQGFWNSLFQAIAIGGFNVLLIGVAVWLWSKGMISAGVIVMAQVYVVTTFNIVWSISKSIVRASAALTDAQEIIDIFNRAPDVVDSLKPKKYTPSRGAITFQSVSFSYSDSEPIIHDLTLDIKPGERVAFVGHSGAGKTTLTKLLLRFADVTSGSILIDGIDIAHIRQDELRASIAYVPQEPVLFHRTLHDNIAYGKPTATVDEVINVSKRAHAHEFIERLPKKYETLVGERGIKLSGGERQRVAIARAMLKDSPILILDEATSSLDSISENYIQEAFRELMQHKTTIVIAHRLSTIQHMDRIIVLGNKGVAEEGTHGELVAKGGAYKALWDSQVGGFISE
jgi:ATP-binding cassette, subfamily B, bacterial